MALAGLIALPLPVFVPPREPFIRIYRSLDNLYTTLGIFPYSKDADIYDSRLIEIGKWDGKGFPCLLRKTYKNAPPPVWYYDFDLYNFRHYDDLDDDLREQIRRTGVCPLEPIRRHVMEERFGKDWLRVAKAGGGYLSRIF